MSRINRVLMLLGALLIMSSSAMAFLDFPMAVRLGSLSGEDSFAGHFWNDSNHAVGMMDYDSGVSTGYYGELANYADMVTFGFIPGGEGHGLWLNKNEESFGNYFVGVQMGEMGSFGEWNHFTLGYGYALEGMNLGVLFNRQSTFGEVDSDGNADTAADEVSETWHMIGVGIDYELDEDTNIDAAFRFTTGSMKDDTPAGTENDIDESGSGFGFGARAFYGGYRDDVVIVPVVQFHSAEYVEDTKDTYIGIGLGFDYTVNEDNNVVFGLNWQNAKNEVTTPDRDTVETTATTLPGVYLGTEHEFTDWFTLRAGASKNWVSSEDADGNSTSAYPFGFTFGAGLALGDWQIDMYLNQGWLYDLGYWFHGNGASQSPIAAMQAKLFF